ncbi:MAG TPA: hypothetical protein VMK12_27235 [Anaeromyxobacteraceae bacterium]|nr:hypothetical protein [Anaeromyxobacteraceae bacterium]
MPTLGGMTILLPLLVAVVGVLVYFASTNPKAQEVGRLMFGCGLLVTLLEFRGPLIHLLG